MWYPQIHLTVGFLLLFPLLRIVQINQVKLKANQSLSWKRKKRGAYRETEAFVSRLHISSGLRSKNVHSDKILMCSMFQRQTSLSQINSYLIPGRSPWSFSI